MTPLEVTVKTLFKHRFGYRFGERACIGCEWMSVARLIEDAERDHAVHVVDMLAAAGVIPTVREWGVRYLASGRTETVTGAEVARGIAAGGEATVISRWSGATAWTAEEAGG